MVDEREPAARPNRATTTSAQEGQGGQGASAIPADEAAAPLAQRLVGLATDAASGVAGQAAGVAGRAVDLGAAAGRGLARRLSRRGARAARWRELHRLNRIPLPSLYDVHPEARNAARRELGLKLIPVAKIRGTAVDGPAQRGSDFLPFPTLRGDNWQSRWQRLRAAQDSLVILPPIDVLQAGDDYWVTDGHNRVAMALYGDQDHVDASVTHVHLAGVEHEAVTPGSLEPILADSLQLRAAGSGRLSRGSSVVPQRNREGEDAPERPGGEPDGSPESLQRPPEEPGGA